MAVATLKPVPADRFDHAANTESRDWKSKTQAILSQAMETKSMSRKLRNQTVATRKALDKQTKEQQATVDEALRRKVIDTTNLKNKLEKRLSSLQGEMSKLAGMKSRCQKLLQDLMRPIHKSETRLHAREKRPTREKISDQVEKSLKTELDELRRAVSSLQSLIASAEKSYQRMYTCRQELQSDLADKSCSLKLDLECLELSARSRGQPPPPQAEFPPVPGAGKGDNAPKSSTHPYVWKQNTDRLLSEAAKAELESTDLRAAISNTIHHITEMRQMTQQQVSDALGNKVKQTSHLHGKLNEQLLEINTELESLEEQKQQTLRALRAKEAPLAVVKDRLRIRRSRPARETVRDVVEEALEAELSKLTMAIAELQRKLEHIEREQEQLMAAQKQVGQDIRDKVAALNIDKYCQNMSRSSASTPSFSSSSVQSVGQATRKKRVDEFYKEELRAPRPPPHPRSEGSRRSR